MGGLTGEKIISLETALQAGRQETRDLYRRYINPGLATMLALLDFDKAFVRAEGMAVWDKDGKRYLDFLGGYGALNLGHNPPEVLAAVKEAMGRPNLLQASLNPLAAALAHNLAQVTPGDLERVFFSNSGTETVEGALKLARASTGREKIIYCQNSFHGKSFGSLSVTGRQKYQRPFGPLLPGCEAVPYDDLEALEAKLSRRDAAAFIVEPIQGEGGVIVPHDGYLKGARELCDRYGSLLIIDEIQTGFGRTGYLFACEHEGVVPDIMCLAKSLGGGVMPIGAYIARPAVWDRAYGGMDKALLHTSTFGGNSLATAAGLAALQSILDQDLAGRAAAMGRYFLERLRQLKEKYDLIKDVRGRGLIIGLEFNQPVGGLLDKLTRGKVNELAGEYFGSLVAGELMNKYQVITAYTLNNPNVIRLEPPLIVGEEEIDHVVNALEAVLRGHGFLGVTLSSTRTALGSLFKRK
ncbi:putrescine aminotransferase [Moorella thermoacetica]|nr:putrescine aminotransferase [Moorella thermoacetica]AKX97227.1 putrescine aminotransferase [Moorella thermoacetica]OIQ57354.1 putrescine aminotransferase [Moorella thermoacetica]QDA01057.1 Putrescine aminotransferase [Moorella thermoacetica]TYL10214.1 Aminotransferase PigE [Moorella thermoacetica]